MFCLRHIKKNLQIMKNVIESFTKLCDVVIYSNKNDDEIDLKDNNGKR